VPTTRQDERRYLAKTIGLARRCGARNGELLAHLSTTDTVRDLDHLRRLVGDRQLSFLGESTGTLIGPTYANLFPWRVRAMALDGLEDPVRFLGRDRLGAGPELHRHRPDLPAVPAALRSGRPGPLRARRSRHLGGRAGQGGAGAAATAPDPGSVGHAAR
jgi:pimeloyl-ACP methyl ester carboxylesterase